jgi:hypothetical protein
MRVLIAGAMCVIAAAVLCAQTPTYGVTVTVAKGVDPAKFKTYSWIKGGPSPDKTVDAQIVAAIDRELPGVGLTKTASGKPDVLVTYYSLRRTDVNLEAKPDSAGRQPQYPVGSLMVATSAPFAIVCPSSTAMRSMTPLVPARIACHSTGSTFPLVGSVLTSLVRFARAKFTRGGSPLRRTPQTMIAATLNSSSNTSSFFTVSS